MAYHDVREDLAFTVNTEGSPCLGVLIHLWLAFLLTVLESDTNIYRI